LRLYACWHKAFFIRINLLDIKHYKTIVFDCDGVVLNSNKTKVNAYFAVAKKMGGTDAQAQALVDHHIAKGSFPRNGKIEYYLNNIVKQPITDELMRQYMHAFDEVLDTTLMECEVATGLVELKATTPQARWMLLSGGDQAELRRIFPRRPVGNVSLAHLFEAGIFGGPDQKEDVLPREIKNGNIQLPALFLGDSKYDHQAAIGAGLDFIFLSDWTEVKDWQSYCQKNTIAVVKNIKALLGS
jgi:phosphoglycolate phosphatase-like HAD superfamily hydrolase